MTVPCKRPLFLRHADKKDAMHVSVCEVNGDVAVKEHDGELGEKFGRNANKKASVGAAKWRVRQRLAKENGAEKARQERCPGTLTISQDTHTIAV
eukprot:scaffold33627_cov201-Skeletonema_dohrnii-CCMP3373.AAC.2